MRDEAFEEVGRQDALGTARRDLLAGGVTVAAAIMLVGLSGPVLSEAVSVIGRDGSDQVLATALILNIALLLFGWRRYADLRREVRERAIAEARVQALASQDPLTGLHNRVAFLAAAAQMIDRARRHGQAAVLVVLDLDHFKTINDVNGHAIGDAALTFVARIIDAHLPPDARAARLGGDEFAVLMTVPAGQTDLAEAFADQLLARLGGQMDTGGAAVHVGASIGLAVIEDQSDTVDALMRRADIAMYASKNAGRHRFSWFDASMERELSTRNALEIGMREGIPLGQFVPFYEQQIDLATGQLHGFEMLARWRHPSRGIVPPDIFIPIAEETGLIADLSMSVMRQAFEEAKSWDPSLTLSVNIAPSQLKDPWLAQKIVKLLVETGFPASRLEVEITESALFENLGVAQSIIGSLKNQGVRIALDDFGTGYSSLSHLRALPFDRIKIDRSFVTSIGSSSESAAIVNAITRLSDSLGLPVTAEGVETPAIERHMRELGCHKAQGWVFGKPMDVGQVRALLAEQNLLPALRGDERGEALRRAVPSEPAALPPVDRLSA
ncbi:EAL domain-containing protein [Sphingomonas changnyeongensis]|uniref:EAL domain-containing protein n=1 Tax=Sphingomonas changnyeongensis TaxID=2698679 RepID=A0A7Z2NW55_9SPHN|nr:EAL domain-containing protein [Sphingomonas changnyeongensis]QHL90948.1 EAL domain-containing protein [Sphingomonas changnyeongensis]